MSSAFHRDPPHAVGWWKGLRNLRLIPAQAMLKNDRQPLAAIEDGQTGIATHESCRSAH
jgi:hypothetical protein